MKFTTNKITWTDAMKEFATEILTKKLDRLAEDYNTANIKLSKINNENIKVSISLNNFRAQAVDSNFYTALGDATTKLKTIITKHKQKYVDKSKESTLPITKIDETLETEISVEDFVSKEKVFNLEPITLETAIMEFEQTDYPFYVYKDLKVKNTVTIIYKRFGDTYGLIRCY